MTARVTASSTTTRSTTTVVRALGVGLVLTLVALAAPVVDELTVGGLTAHLQATYAGTGVAAPAASVIVVSLVGLQVLGVLSWLVTLRAVRRGRRHAPVTATAFLVLGTVLAVGVLSASEYGRPILPVWFGVLGLLPVLPGLVAVGLLWRRTGRSRR